MELINVGDVRARTARAASRQRGAPAAGLVEYVLLLTLLVMAGLLVLR